jgi:hypothetical protein
MTHNQASKSLQISPDCMPKNVSVYYMVTEDEGYLLLCHKHGSLFYFCGGYKQQMTTIEDFIHDKM